MPRGLRVETSRIGTTQGIGDNTPMNNASKAIGKSYSSILPSSPLGKINTINQLFKAGIITREYALDALRRFDPNDPNDPLDPHVDKAYQMWEVLVEIEQYREDLGKSEFKTLSEFIDKWKPAYDRVMAMKAFL
jgi:hypothetical protein